MGKELQWTWSFTCKQPIISHPTSSRYYFSKKKKKEEDIPHRIVYWVLNGLEKQALQNKQLVGQVKLWEIWISGEREIYMIQSTNTSCLHGSWAIQKYKSIYFSCTFHNSRLTSHDYSISNSTLKFSITLLAGYY